MFHPASLTALLGLGLLAGRVVAAPASTPRSDTSISWGSCESFGVNATVTNLECAYYEVPMGYHDNSAGNARLALIKLAATADKLGTIFFNPGGPGGSGIQTISESVQLFTQLFRGNFDIVSWDPRGVGHTFPGEVYCFNSTAEDAGYWNYTPISGINETISGRFNERDFNELYSKADLTEQKFKDFAERCQNGPSGPYLKYLGTSSTIRDLVSLGDAIVGQGEPINYWGISYGTVIGFNFINMFPERAGYVVLDGVVRPDLWITYELLPKAVADTEKTYSGLTDGCAKAGRTGCKLIEFIGDNASGNDVKTLLNYAHDVILELYRGGYEVPDTPASLRTWLFYLMYSPETWSNAVNSYIYPVVGSVLQAAHLHNITVPCGVKYNLPSGNFTINSLTPIGDTSATGLTSYTMAAIAGADDFVDSEMTIEDLFDIIVNTTRCVTPTFGTVADTGYTFYGWPTRSVERLPPYSPKKLKNPVLLIGNTADPITPFASAEKTANLLGDDAFLLEQLGFGHTSLAQYSSCTAGFMYNYFSHATLPQGRSAQCPVDDPNLFPALSGTTTSARRSNLFRRWW